MFTEEKIESLWVEYTTLLRSTNRPGIEELIKWLEMSDMKHQPSSQAYHGCYAGGLVAHSLNVYKAATNIISNMGVLALPEKKLAEIPPESIIISALLHDICKLNFYKPVKKVWKDENEPNQYAQWKKYWGYTINDAFPLGHGQKSTILAMHFIRLTAEEILAITWHMGLSDPGLYLSPYEKPSMMAAINNTPLVEIIMISDHFASFMMEQEIDQKIANACN